MRHIASIMLACVFLSGCANFNSIWRETAVGPNSVISIDAKQRFLRTGIGQEKQLIVCAEKSPDVFSALAGALSASGSSPEGIQAALSLSNSEQAASIAFRTQLTQAQAELLSRICDLHANGALSDTEVATQLRRFQNTMTAMLAIEQLTSRNQPITVALTTDSSASTGDNVADAQKAKAATVADLSLAESAVRSQEEKVKTKEQELEKAQQAFKIAADDSKEKTNAASDITRLEGELKTEKAEREKLRRVRDEKVANDKAADSVLRAAGGATRAAARGRSSGTEASGVGEAAKAGASAQKETAEAVRDIVFHVIDQSFIQDTCLQLLSKKKLHEERPDVIPLCNMVLREYLQRLARGQEIERELDLARLRADPKAARKPPAIDKRPKAVQPKAGMQ